MMDSALQRALEDLRAGRMDLALAAVQRVLKQRPQDADAAQILGIVLVHSGAPAAAVPHLAAAVEAEPGNVRYRNNYANALLHLKRYADAAAQWEETVRIDPQYAIAYLGLARARMHLDFAAARDAAEAGMKLRPVWPEMTRELAGVLQLLGEVDAAIVELERALAIDPLQPVLWSLYLLLLNYGWQERSLIEAHRDFGRHLAPPLNPPHLDHNPDRLLRVGLLSAHLRTHSVAFFVEPLLRNIPESISITVFSLAATPEDQVTQRLQGTVNEWLEVGSFDDGALNGAIRAEHIDVLLELDGHTAGNRLPALADKPAPIIVDALGYPNTTGLRAVDWRVVDSITDPPGADALATERLLRLDPCFLCYSPPEDAPEPALPPSDAPLTFGSFNVLLKISPATLALWSEVMNALPDARFLLKTFALTDATAKARLLERFSAAGISAERIAIVPHAATLREHLADYGRMHIALDTVPYNGTTTTCEALWMGVPVLCLAGKRHAARVGATLLSAIGRADLLAASAEEYVANAVRLASDRAELQRMRAELRLAMQQSPLLDEVGYASRFYQALRSCWADRCAVEPR